MKILFVYADENEEWNTSQWRCANPADAINRHALTSGSIALANTISIQDFTELKGKAVEMIGWADMIIVERLVLSNIIGPILALEAHGKVIIGDIDDSYQHMPNNIATYDFWHKGVIKIKDAKGNDHMARMAVPPVEQLKWGLKLVHAISSPSKIILDDWKDYNNHCLLIPNYIPSASYIRYRKEKIRSDYDRDNKFIIGWGGSWTHYDSWGKSGLVAALREICRNCRNVTIRIAGGDKRLVDAINIPGRVFLHEWTDTNHWAKLIGDWDMGVVPLSGAYDNRRSWIKSLEYTLMGIPWVGSAMAPTEELKDYGYRVKNTDADWKKAIYGIMEHYHKAKAKVDSGYEYALQQDLDANVGNLIQKYQELYQAIKGTHE